MKVNVTIDDALLGRVDAYAKQNYMSRSGLVTLALTQFLNSNDVVLALSDIALSIRKIADNGVVDNETMRSLEDFERIAKLITQK